MNLLFHKKKSARIISFLMILLMIFAWMPTPAYAAYGNGTNTFTLNVLGKDGSTLEQVGQWTYDSASGDLTGAPFVTTGNLVYSGQDGYTNCGSIAVATKYIELDDLMEYAADEMGYDVDDDSTLTFTSGDNKTSTGVYSSVYGIERHYYKSYIIDQSFTTDAGTVPSALAIKSVSKRNTSEAGAGSSAIGSVYQISDDTTLNTAISYLEGITDDSKGLRLLMGQQNGNTEANLGGMSLSYITSLKIEPVYYDISVVTDGAVSVSTDDGYFKAASGESVSFTLSGVDSGKKALVSIKDAVNTSYDVTKSGNTYTFIMPATDAAININISDANAWSGTADTSWYHSSGTTFNLSTQEELAGLAALVNAGNDFSGKAIKLNNDIALNADNLYTSADVYFQDGSTAEYSGTFSVPTVSTSAVIWTPAGINSHPFRGTFDGDGHTISGLYTTAANSYQGLFGALGVGSCVKNVTVSGVVTGKQYVGGIAGYASGATIDNAVNNAVIYASGGASPGGSGTSGAGHVGGILGMGTGTSSNPVTIKNCINNGTVTASNCYKGGRAGGIVGIFDSSSDYALITQCANNGTIKAYQYVGGIAGGQFANYVTLKSCYNTGNVTGTSSGKTYVGGIAGKSRGPVLNCYNMGNIYSTATSGSISTRFAGIVGETENTTAKIKNCYSVGSINWPSGRTIGTSGNIIGSQASNPVNCYYLSTNALAGAGDASVTTAKSDAELKAAGMPEALGAYFIQDTGSKNNGYPALHWQYGLTRPPVLYNYTVDQTLDPIWTVDVDSSGISGSAIYEGSTVTVSVSRSEKAYASSLNDLSVKDADGSTIPVTAGTPSSGGYNTVGSCSYTFTMPENAVNIGLTATYAALNVYAQTGTGAAVLVKTYTRAQMISMATQSAVYYTGYDTLPAAVVGKAAQCVTLENLLANAGLSFTSGCSIYLNTIDSFPATFKYSDLFGQPRYYYPNIYAATNKDAGRSEMKPVFVIKGYQSRFSDFSAGQSIDTMPCDTLNAYRFVFGQTETQFNNGVPATPYKTVGNFTKWTSSLTVYTPAVTKAALTAAINAANTNVSTASVSVDGSDVSTSSKWVTSVVKTTYTNAITAAQVVADNASATQAQVDSAVTTLEAATAAFNAAKTSGTKTSESGSSGGGGGGGGGGGSDTTTGTGNSNVEKGSDGTQKAVAVTNTTAATDASGKAKASVTSDTLSNTLKSAQESAKNADDKAGNKSGTTAVEVKVEVKAASNAQSVETVLPVDTLKNMADQKNTMLTVSSPIAEITLDQTALKAIVSQAGDKVALSAEKIDAASLPVAAKEKVGDAPVYDLKVLGASGTVSDFKGGNVTVSIPYELKSGETADEVTVYYIDDKGELTRMSCAYNKETGTATFVTNHFSYYTVVAEPAAKFTDLNSSAYYYDAVNYAVKAGLFNGTGETTFGPAAGMTRAMFVTVLGRASGADVSKYSDSGFSDVASGSWYANYVQWAYENKIVSGTGDGRFSPNQQITRDQMAAILTNYCKWKGITSDSAVQLTYKDLADVPAWAKDGVTFCTAKGWLTGYPDGSFLPGKTATRAEAATVLYKSLITIKSN